MVALLIGYARCSTDEQDLTAQREGLLTLGVAPARVYVDHGLTGTNRDRPGLREALAACREGDTLVVTKLDRLARSLPDARAIADELTARQVRLSIGASVYDPTDPVGRLPFNVLAMVAEFESDLIRLRAREGMQIAKAKGHLRNCIPKLTVRQEAPRRAPDPPESGHQARPPTTTRAGQPRSEPHPRRSAPIAFPAPGRRTVDEVRPHPLAVGVRLGPGGAPLPVRGAGRPVEAYCRHVPTDLPTGGPQCRPSPRATSTRM